MNIWLKEVELTDDEKFCNLLIELANYENAYARPVPSDFTIDDFDDFKKARIQMAAGINLPKKVIPTNSYFVMDDDMPIGTAALKHSDNPDIAGGNLACCLKKEYQNKGVGRIVNEKLSQIAYFDLGLKKTTYVVRDENIQSQKSLDKINANLIGIHDGYHFYEVDLEKKYGEKPKHI